MAERVWRVGELARETGVTVRALHHYDRIGLLVPSSRTSGGHRCYTQADVRRLHRIVALRGFGFPLEDIAAVLHAEPDQDPRDLIQQQLALVDERITRATGLRDRLLGVLDGLDRAAEPSTSEFLRLIEETITISRPLTPAEFARLTRQREEYARQSSSEELAALAKRRADAFAAMSPAERERLRAERAQMIPPGIETAGGDR
ncbi:MerR family transcriptional regulator [Nocardia terpenica]|uniref:MerR family transcriptional regulator n=1 Tax=Nocardia terpenica TaxID=455432 RepID=UPI001894A174|nr:MerR family transcriptional regulator [Nocardia terpenica]MBF6059955.1 MerR family transcriptional regulator [Nocardia terpenica]MBF6102504.1 MerR family transcriptional regulator [Nocardia terpenica]MBF6111305.1 MerR family transcriptional regulator [Nocardia terpenica]MBF6117436.1 MerR family transcriptional regulator [Nocardia terpenica]MBF6150723.1 MerR family transcriptional regulator [Nocardia terpenica]